MKEIDSLKALDLYPIVPIINYNPIPYVPWDNPLFQIKNIEELEALSPQYEVTYTDKTGTKKYQEGLITGFALLTGEISGVMVIDLDLGHKDGENGIETFKIIWPEPIDTLTVKTPNGGVHLYFNYRKGLNSKAAYFPGIDVRSDGGCIVLQGSKRRLNNGDIGKYELLIDSPIAEMPAELFELFLNQNTTAPEKQNEKKPCDQTGLSYEKGSRNSNLFRDATKIIAQSTIRDSTTIHDLIQGLNLIRCSPPLDEKEVNSIVQSVQGRLFPEYCNKDGKVIIYSLVRSIMNKNPCYSLGNLLFVYNNNKGVYENMDIQALHRMYFDYCTTDNDRTATKAKQFSETLLMASYEQQISMDEKHLVNCLNGVLNLKTGALHPHDSKYRLSCQFQANYEKWSECAFEVSKFKHFLNDLLDFDTQNILQEAMGLMISPHASEVQTSFAFLGNGSNGKSALMLIMQALFPSTDFIASIGLSDFAGDFDIAQAEGKQVNMVMDDDMTGVKVGKSFKSMICGEPVRVNRKNRDIKTLSFNLTHFFGLNRLPSIIDKTLGFYRRFCIIPFTNTFGALEDVTAGNATKVKNPSITKAIIEKEADIVFNWALQGLHRLKENNWKLSTSKASNMAMEQYKEETDSAYSFFKMCITLKEGSKISCNELYQSYVVYCSNSGIKNCLNQNNLGRQLSLYGISRRRGKERYYTDIEINHKTFNY